MQIIGAISNKLCFDSGGFDVVWSDRSPLLSHLSIPALGWGPRVRDGMGGGRGAIFWGNFQGPLYIILLGRGRERVTVVKPIRCARFLPTVSSISSNASSMRGHVSFVCIAIRLCPLRIPFSHSNVNSNSVRIPGPQANPHLLRQLPELHGTRGPICSAPECSASILYARKILQLQLFFLIYFG